MNNVEELVEALKKDKVDLECNMAINCITSTPFVIELPYGLYVSPEIINNKTTGKVIRTTNPLNATSYGKENAKILAKAVKNVNGAGKVVSKYDAVRTYYTTVCKMLEFFEEVKNV